MYLVSACLMGDNCKYNGGNNRNQAVLDFLEGKQTVKLCPETAGKLPCPRPPAEWVNGRVIDKEGKDVTQAFLEGSRKEAQRVLRISKERQDPIELAILKANSPSCGCGKIYDGTFSGTTIPGDGCLTKILKEQGIPVITEKDLLEKEGVE